MPKLPKPTIRLFPHNALPLVRIAKRYRLQRSVRRHHRSTKSRRKRRQYLGYQQTYEASLTTDSMPVMPIPAAGG